MTAVEPSAVMIEQRPAGAAPAIQASAEALPFEDDRFDAAMATFSDEAELRELLGEVEFAPIPISADCTDGFCGSWWRRPAAYLDPAVRAGISVFQLLPEEEVHVALEQLRRDLADGTWARRNAELIEREEIDLGIRLVIARV